MEEQRRIKNQKIASKIWMESFSVKFKELNEFRASGIFCDITLVTREDKKVKAHRNILHTGSRFFKNLFSSGMKDSTTDSIDLKNMKGDLLEKVITFLYRGEVEVDEIDDIEQITQYANYFQMDELIEECTKVLSDLIDNDNCLKYWRLAQECFAEKFEKLCISHLLSNQLYDNDDFFNKLCKEEIKILYSDNRLKWSEEIKFEKILQWVKMETQKQDEFESKIFDFLESIKFFEMNERFLITKVLGNSDLIGCEKIIQKIVELAERKWTEINENEDGEIQKSASNNWTNFAIFGNEMVTVTNEGDMDVFQIKKNYYSRFRYTTFNNFLMFCGGEGITNKVSTNFCEYLAPTMKEWKNFPTLITPRAAHGCIYFDEKIYVCGGLRGSELSNVEFYDFGKEKWFQGPNMKTERANFGLCSMNRSLYAVGGGWGACNIEMIDPRSTNEWKEIYPKFQRKLYTQSISINNDIYCFRSEEKPCIFDTRIEKFRDWEGENYVVNVGDDIFEVFQFNNSLNIIQKNTDKEYIDIYKYDMKGDLISSKLRCYHYSGWIGALVTLYYQK